MKRPNFVAPLNLQLIENDKDESLQPEREFHLGDTTYRHDGLTIGHDYLRVGGATVSRGQLHPALLSFEETIGRGAFSKVQRAVWKQKDKRSQQQVAIKQYSLLYDPSHHRHKMLIQELLSLSRLESPCLVRLHGAFLEQENVTVVLEYMNLGSLHQVLQKRNNKPFCEEMLAAVAFQLLSGLSYLHARRIIHRDFKSDNVLLHSNGSVKLCDFGLASLGDSSMKKTVLGTATFMAPERLRAKVYGRSSDIWSFGLVLIHCATAQIPWNNYSNSIVDLLVTIEETAASEKIPSHLDGRVQEILCNTLQLDPEKRMPASIILQSPWFFEQSIMSVHDAMQLLCRKISG